MRYILFFLLLPLTTFAQQIPGKVINDQDKEPIPHLTISVDGSNYYVVTNDDGEFLLDANQVMDKTIRINNIYYSEFSKKITSNQSIMISLDLLAYQMEEMLIYDKPIKDVFLEIIENSEKSLVNNAKMSTYYKEKYFEKGNHLKEADALVDFYIKSKATKIDAVVNQSRVLDSDFQKSKSQQEQDGQLLLSLYPNDMMEGAMRFKILREVIKEKKYECYITTKNSGEKTINTLYFSPVKDSKDENLVVGKVLFDPELKLILEFNVRIDDEAKKRSTFKNFIVARFRLEDIRRNVKYNYANGMYYLTYLESFFDIDVKSKMAKIDSDFSNISQVYVLGVEKTSTFPDKKDVFKKEQLYKSGNRYTQEFWNLPQIKNYSN